MIDWGRIPAGSTASIYWPQVPAADVVALAADSLWPARAERGGQPYDPVRGHRGVTYVPSRRSAGDNFAGLLTVDLPPIVVAGEEFDVVVRRLAFRDIPRIDGLELGAKGAASTKRLTPWRYVVGTFDVKIPVATSATMLGPEEDTLAIMRWRLQQMLPSDRWHPVLDRYVELIADRVAALGGDPSKIAPSPSGAGRRGRRKPCDDVVEFRGSIDEVLFDCHGKLEGFVLVDCCERHAFHTREPHIGELALRAIRDGLTVTVFALAADHARIRSLAISG